jgi:hypothetical protein
VARGPVRTLGATGAWLQRAGRIIASNQRLLIFPIALQVVTALLMLPLTLSSHVAVTFDVFARDAADPERRMADLVRASSTSTGTFVVLAVIVAVGALCTAWLGGAFIRSLGEGGVTWWPGTRPFVPLVVLYLVSELITIGIAVMAGGDESVGTAWLALLLVVVVSVPVMFADYAIVLEERGLLGGLTRSARIWGRRPGQCAMALFTFLVVGQLVFELFVQRIEDADGVFPGFFGAQLLVQALVAYASDCVRIALLLETPDEPATAPGSANPE